MGAKIRPYYTSSTAADVRQYLDVWDRYSVLTSNTWRTTGQEVAQTSLLVADPTTTLGLSALGVGTGTALLAQALATGDTVRIGGTVYSVITGAAAGAAVTGVTVAPAPAVAITATAALAASSRKVTQQGLEIQTQRFTPTLDTINVSAHGIDIYKEFPAAFFNAYTPYHYGGPNINAPRDVGSLFIPFSLYPGSYQPSGHINVSRAREFYLKYTAASGVDFTSASTPGLLICIASAINKFVEVV